MSAVNPYNPPQAALADIEAGSTSFSTPKLWSASGRIGRLRYLAYHTVGYLFVIAGALAIGLVAALMRNSELVGWSIVLALIPYAVFMILCAIQRAHDMDWSGWTVLLMVIPLVALVWLFKSGSSTENRFGAPPPPNTTAVKIGASFFVVLFLGGILAAIALPAYQQYTMRAKAMQTQSQQN